MSVLEALSDSAAAATVVATRPGTTQQQGERAFENSAQSATQQPRGRAAIALQGVTCASCAWAIEKELGRVSGVIEARVDIVRKQLDAIWDPRYTEIETVLATVRGLGYGAQDADRPTSRPAVQGERRALQRLLIAALSMMQVMMLSLPTYTAGPGEIAPDIEQLLRLAQFALTLPVISFCAWPIYRAAWRDARIGRIGMDAPVTIGLVVAAAASVWAVVRGGGPVYFDSITMFVALLLVSRWLQGRGLARASAYLDALARRQVPDTQRLIDYPAAMVTETVSAARLAPGDAIWVRPGEIFPADGTVIAGESACSEALLTGESRPVVKRTGDSVLASGVNLEQALVVRVDRAGEATAVAALARLAAAASRERPALVEFADRAARRFLVAMLVVVGAAAIAWALIDPARVVPVTVAILIVTCPCALSLAVPVALAAAQAALARRGVLVTRSAAIETLGRVDHVAFDKTGTLTQGRMALVGVQPLGDMPADEALRFAAALEQASNHPSAVALRAAAHPPLPAATDPHNVVGHGVEAVFAGRRVRLGRIDYALAMIEAAGSEARATVLEALATPATGEANTDSVSLMADDRGPIALFRFADPLRDDAAALVSRLAAEGKSLSLLSGDRAPAVHAVAAALGIEDFVAAALPETKRARVQAMQREGKVVAMVGDGLNDAPVIAQADVSAAFASASTLAQTRADFIVLSDRLSDLGAAFELCRRALAVIRQNLAWALAYNLVAIPVAASGAISPLWAGAGMAISSLVVVANALRLLPRERATANDAMRFDRVVAQAPQPAAAR